MPDNLTMRERIAARIADHSDEALLDIADAILDELREPTEAMSAAGDTITSTVLYNASSVWQAMIDEARQERKTP